MSGNSNSGSIETRKDYKDTPQGQYQYWQEELDAAHRRVKRWHKKGDRVVNRYLDKTGADRIGEADENRKETARPATSLNLFYSNTTTLNSLLYGNLPTVDVSRKFADANDDVARVAAEIMERLLNNDITLNGETYDAVLRGTLQDRLLAGLGCARVRYEVVTEGEEMIDEIAPIDYYYWRDVLWGWGRSFADLPWLAFRTYLTKDEMEKRFGKEIADDATYKKQIVATEDGPALDPELDSAWQKAEVWEIWDKTKRQTVWVTRGYDKVLKTQDDPLKLNNFFPCPPFFIANATTSLYMPTPDFHMSQDLYNEIDVLQSRITIITEAVKVIGVYDQAATGIARMFTEGVDNKLIPVENWAMFAEKGGIAGQVDWYPVQDVVNTLDKLRQLRDETIGLLQQVTGMSDLMQGNLNNQHEGVGQSQIKARFGSVRIQKLQDEFAAFASGLMQLKAEVIATHFEGKTIVQQSNMDASFDAELVPQAIELIKQPQKARLRITIRPESVAMTDFAALQDERTSYMNALSTFMQSAAPLIEADPAAKPFLLQLMQWGLSGFKGSSEIEGIVDKAIEASQQEAKNQEDEQDPEQQKMEMAQQLEQQKVQGEMQKIQAKAQADMQIREQDMQMDMQTATHAHQTKMAEIAAQTESKIAEIQAKLEADLLVEQAQTQSNMAQNQAQVEGEMEKAEHQTELDLIQAGEATRNKIDEISSAASAKIAEKTVKDSDTGGDSE
jgi:hypothetical protein